MAERSPRFDPATRAAKAARERRLAEAMRQNLARRKAQQRALVDDEPASTSGDPPEEPRSG